jgi:membrane-associated phospholipid phosphatase
MASLAPPRDRPGLRLWGVGTRPVAFLDAAVVRESARGLGFVSGHAAISAAMATALWPWLGRGGRVVAVVLAAWVSLGRMLGGAHLPLDVIGGISLGVLAGLVVHAVLGVPHR